MVSVSLHHFQVRSAHSGSWGANRYAKAAGELNVQPESGKLRLGLESTDLSKRSLDRKHNFHRPPLKNFSRTLFYLYVYVVVYAHGKEKKDGQEGFQGPFADAKFNLRIGKDLTRVEMKTEFSKDLSARSLVVSGNTSSTGEFKVQAVSKVSCKFSKYRLRTKNYSILTLIN